MIANVKRYIIILIIPILSFIGCQKEIELPYRSVDPIYVIEANVENDYSLVRISQSRDMDNPDTDYGVQDDATVLITDNNDEVTYPLVSIGDGYYTSHGGLTAQPFTSYTLNVDIDGAEFDATSQTFAAPIISFVTISREIFMEGMDDMVFCLFLINDLAGYADYYRYRISINDSDENWVLISDFGTDGESSIAYKPLIKKDENDDMVSLETGDTITIEVQSIDQGIYDYFYSLDAGESNGSNPISNITGGCLGYFSASTITQISYVIDMESVSLIPL